MTHLDRFARLSTTTVLLAATVGCYPFVWDFTSRDAPAPGDDTGFWRGDDTGFGTCVDPRVYHWDSDGDGAIGTGTCGTFCPGDQIPEGCLNPSEVPEDCDDTDASKHPGHFELTDLKDNDCDGDVDELVRPEFDPFADELRDGATDAWFVDGDTEADLTAAAVYDLDGNGVDDVVTADAYAHGDAYQSGILYFALGPMSGVQNLDSAPSGSCALDSCRIGVFIEIGQGLTGSGGADLVMSSGSDVGGLGVIAGFGIDPPNYDITPSPTDYGFGRTSDIAPDLTGNGNADLLSTANDAIYLFEGPITSTMSTDDRNVTITRTFNASYGKDYAGVGDVTGDGVADLATASAHFSYSGSGTGMRAFLHHGPLSGAIDATDAEDIFDGDSSCESGSGCSGYEVGLGSADIDNDGTLDLWIGEPHNNGYTGKLWVIRGGGDMSTDLDGASIKFEGNDFEDTVGLGLRDLGDIDGDSQKDVLLVSGGVGVDGNYDEAFADVFLGIEPGVWTPSDALLRFQHDSQNRFPIGDLDGDGGLDVLVQRYDSLVLFPLEDVVTSLE